MIDWSFRQVSDDEERAIAVFMASVARLPLPGNGLPDSEVVWLKAQLLRRWEAERKVQAPLDVMEPVQIAAGLVAAVLLLAWSLPSLLRLLPGA